MSNRCKRVTRSVLAAEVYGLVLEFDHDYIIRSMLEEILGKPVPIDAYVHSKTLFDVVVKDCGMCKKHLQIDIYALRGTITINRKKVNFSRDKTEDSTNPFDHKFITEMDLCFYNRKMFWSRSNKSFFKWRDCDALS